MVQKSHTFIFENDTMNVHFFSNELEIQESCYTYQTIASLMNDFGFSLKMIQKSHVSFWIWQ